MACDPRRRRAVAVRVAVAGASKLGSGSARTPSWAPRGSPPRSPVRAPSATGSRPDPVTSSRWSSGWPPPSRSRRTPTAELGERRRLDQTTTVVPVARLTVWLVCSTATYEDATRRGVDRPGTRGALVGLALPVGLSRPPNCSWHWWSRRPGLTLRHTIPPPNHQAGEPPRRRSRRGVRRRPRRFPVRYRMSFRTRSVPPDRRDGCVRRDRRNI